MLIVMMWKSISSSGCEYLIVGEDLGSSPMYANCMLFYFCVHYFKVRNECE